MGFLLVPKIVTLNDLERRNGHLRPITLKLLKQTRIVCKRM